LALLKTKEVTIMSYTITLKNGSFFFAGSIAIVGNGNSVTVEEPLEVNVIKAINISQLSGVIDSDVPLYVEETSEANIFIESEVAEEATTPEEKTDSETTVVEEPEVEKKGGRKTKRG
jgi:hypothetical protein